MKFCKCGCGTEISNTATWVIGHHRKGKPNCNKTEIFTDGLVQKARPTDFIYSGDGKIWIAGKNPDWFNVNGKKQVIEFFGGLGYWHKLEDEEIRKSHFAKYGYDCLIIWESELKNPEQVISRIQNF